MDNDKIIKEDVRNGFKEIIVNDSIDREIVERLRTEYDI